MVCVVTTMTKSLLFNPRTYDGAELDEESRRLMLATIEFFESRGKGVLKEHDRERTWYADFLDFVKRERVFATLLTPAAEGGGDPGQALGHRADLRLQRDHRLLRARLLVHVAGLDPRPRADLAERERGGQARAPRELLDDGAIFAFGLSEKEHGADIYSTDMVLTPDGDGGFRANGGKYYIGNGNLAGMVSVFGRRADVEGPDGYVFFAADSQHPAYELVKNVVNSQIVRQRSSG